MTRTHLPLNDMLEDYYRDNPAEIDAFLQTTFAEYAKDQDTEALFSALRIISRVKGVTATAEAAEMTRKGLQKALSGTTKPRFESVAAIMAAMGYQLMPMRVQQV